MTEHEAVTLTRPPSRVIIKSSTLKNDVGASPPESWIRQRLNATIDVMVPPAPANNVLTAASAATELPPVIVAFGVFVLPALKDNQPIDSKKVPRMDIATL